MSRQILILICLIIFYGGIGLINTPAQEKKQVNTMNEDFRKQPPTPLSARAINLPNPVETVLPNGLKVVIVEDKKLPIVSFRLAFRHGTATDPEDLPGLTSLMAGMMTEGTKNRSSLQIAQEVEKLGGSVNVSVSADNTIVSASALANYGLDILKLMADVALNPIFPDKELTLNKQNTKQGLQFQRSQPDFLADERISRILYGKHPYGTISATLTSVDAITREKLLAQHKLIFIPNDAVLVIVGDVKQAQIIKDVKDLFGSWESGVAAGNNFATPPNRTVRTLSIVDRPGSAQSNIVLGNLAITRNSPDYFPMLVLNQIFGGGASSRLFMNLREEKGYTYGAYSSVDSRRFAGSFESSAEVRTDVTGASLKEFFSELEKIRNNPVPNQELQDAKNYLTGVFPIRLETQESLTNQLVTIQMYGLPADYLQTYRDKINAVTAEDIQKTAKQYITPDKIAIVIVGDAKSIYEQAKQYAQNIELFDNNGQSLDIATLTKKDEPKNSGKKVEITELVGVWNLEVSVQGQSLPISMTLKQEGEKLSGTLESGLGGGTVEDGKIEGNKFSANGKIEVQGQPVDLKIVGNVDGKSMKGTVTPSIPGFSDLPFTGTKK
jgi:zinc protease